MIMPHLVHPLQLLHLLLHATCYMLLLEFYTLSMCTYWLTGGVVCALQEVLTINVQPGWKDGTRITFAGKGDELPGQPPQVGCTA